MLGGALNLMSEVGEEISQQMPQQTIRAGDVIDVQMTVRLPESYACEHSIRKLTSRLKNR